MRLRWIIPSLLQLHSNGWIWTIQSEDIAFESLWARKCLIHLTLMVKIFCQSLLCWLKFISISYIHIILLGSCFYYAYCVLLFRWFERATMTVIIINCITLGSYEPCQDISVCDGKCQILKVYIDLYYFQS